jgi:hypothetical protein
MDDDILLTDLIPKRLGFYWLLFAAGLGIIALLELGYHMMPQWAEMMGHTRIASLDLEKEGSLGGWFSSILWVTAGLIATLIYTINREEDDYHRFGDIWLWAAGCCFLMSMDETASLHEGFRDAMVWLSGTTIFREGAIWWIAVYTLLLGMVGSRLLVEMRHYLPSCNAFFVTGLCYLVAVAAEVGLLVGASHARTVMIEEGAEMLGNVFLLLAFGLYARHLIINDPGVFSLWYANLWRNLRWPSLSKPRPRYNRYTSYDDQYDYEEEGYPRTSRRPRTQRPRKRPRRAMSVGSRNEAWPGSRKMSPSARKALNRRIRSRMRNNRSDLY